MTTCLSRSTPGSTARGAAESVNSVRRSHVLEITYRKVSILVTSSRYHPMFCPAQCVIYTHLRTAGAQCHAAGSVPEKNAQIVDAGKIYVHSEKQDIENGEPQEITAHDSEKEYALEATESFVKPQSISRNPPRCGDAPTNPDPV
jgi:hypothetical protein